MEFRFALLLFSVVVSLLYSLEDSLEELNYLKELYRLNSNKGKFIIVYVVVVGWLFIYQPSFS